MRRLLRGHLLQATSAASTAAIALASVQGVPDEQALALVDDAIANLIAASVTAMEAVGIDAEERQRQHLYVEMVDYVSAPRGAAPRLSPGRDCEAAS